MEAAALGKEATVATATGTVAFQFQKDTWWKSLWFSEYYIGDSFCRRKCPKTGLFKFWANNISFGQKTFQIHDGKSEEWVAVEGIFFRRQDFKSFQREAASPITSCISCHIGNIKKRSIIVQLDCSLRKHIYRHLLHLTTCLSRLS